MPVIEVIHQLAYQADMVIGFAVNYPLVLVPIALLILIVQREL